ncbi:MAG: AMP-binding protein [Spirulina sp. SIO3F2]|nr:AMP-binding protein [Spirulina sp. SIO3F2]
MTTNLVRLLHERVEHTPAAIALIDAQHKQYTFADILTASQRLAGYLTHCCQLKLGDGVLLLQPLSAELYIALAAIWQVGAIAVILNPLLGQRYIAHCAHEINLKVWLAPSWLFTTQLFSPTLRRIRYKIAVGVPVPGTVTWQQVQKSAPKTDAVELNAEAIALLSFTSGTTGQPKPIARSHHLLLAQYQALAPVLQWQPGAQELTTLPLFGLANLVAGGATVIPPVNVRRPARVSGLKLRRAIAQYQIERIVAAPGILGRLLLGASKPLPSLHQIFIGGAPVTQKLRDRLQHLALNAQITVVYGATEAEPIAVIPPAPLGKGGDWKIPSIVPTFLETEGRPPQMRSRSPSQPLAASPPLIRGEGGINGLELSKPASFSPNLGLFAGQPVPSLELRILDTATNQSALPNQPGEIIVRGAHVLNSPHPQQRLTLQGQQWHRTGDLGYLDVHGQLWLLGRATAAIREDHGILYPLTVECLVNELPGVARSALVQWRGRRVLLVEWERHELRTENCKLKTALAWAQLDHIITVRAIPTDRRHNAKVNYPQLARWLRSPWGKWQLWLKMAKTDQD